ncbi:MAG: hypothetical protein ABEJ99_04730 [Candidatus Nanohaloarchaea archaeon]
MPLSEEVNKENYNLDRGIPVFSDVDNTLLAGDSGKEWLKQAGVVSDDDWDEFIQEQRHEGLGHSNELVYFLSQNPEMRDWLHDEISEVSLNERRGIDLALTHRYEHDIPNIGSSAGYRLVIEQVTNGNLHDIIAGDIQGGDPVFNGQNEKRSRVEQYLEQMDYDGEFVSLADSNGDLGKVEAAAESGGFGIAVGPSVEEARDNIDRATIYVGDSNPEHHATGALVNYLTVEPEYRMSPGEMREQYGFDFSTASIAPGELATTSDIDEIEGFMDYITGDYSE